MSVYVRFMCLCTLFVVCGVMSCGVCVCGFVFVLECAISCVCLANALL